MASGLAFHLATPQLPQLQSKVMTGPTEGPLCSQRAAWLLEHFGGHSPRTPGGAICLPR